MGARLELSRAFNMRGNVPGVMAYSPLTTGGGKAPEVEEQERARLYNRLKRRARIINLCLTAGMLAALLFTGWSVALREYLESVSANPWVLVCLYFLILMMAGEVLSLPLSHYSGYRLEKRYGLSRESVASFYLDRLKGFAVSLGLGLGAVELVYWLMREMPGGWWLAAAAAFAGIFVLLANLAPVLLFPIFFRFEPLEAGELKRRIDALAGKAQTSIRGVFRMDMGRKTRAANAALAGTGSTRRVILTDTLLDNFTVGEIETIVAHELGHHVYRHIPRLIALQSMVTLLALFLAHIVMSRGVAYFGLEEVHDVAGLPLLAFSLAVVSLALLPLANFYSRKLETVSDRYALETTGNPAAFMSAMRKLAALNLAEMEPHPVVEFLFYGHPSISKRLKEGEEFARKHGEVA